MTRQLLYLHFAGRSDLLLAVTRAVDEDVRLAEQQRVDASPDARTALREAVALQGRIKPRIAPVTAAIDRLRPAEPDAAAAWREREDGRFQHARQVVDRLAGEDALRSGWSTSRWVERTTELLESALIRDADTGQ